jgi:hypothetical protein
VRSSQRHLGGPVHQQRRRLRQEPQVHPHALLEQKRQEQLGLAVGPGNSGVQDHHPRNFFATPRQLSHVPHHVGQIPGLDDPFASGQGAGSYAKTGSGATDHCWRSANAYAHLIANNPALHVKLTNFAACDGAQTDDIVSRKQTDYDNTSLAINNKQLDAVTADTGLITLSIGGNNVDFAGTVMGCIFSEYPGCVADGKDGRTTPVELMTASINDATKLENKLVDTYTKILNKDSTNNSRLYVINYPVMTPWPNSKGGYAKMCDLMGRPGDPGVVHEGGVSGPDRRSDISKAFYNVLTLLNSKIASAVKTVNGKDKYKGRIYLVNVAANTSTPFYGHGLCDSSRHFNSVATTGEGGGSIVRASYHPTAAGHQDYYTLFKNAYTVRK